MQSNLINRSRFLKSIVLSNFRRSNFPLKLGFIVTYRCNMRCAMCGIWKKPLNKNELTLGEIDNFFKRANKFSWIGITGGESFLRDDLTEIVDRIIFYSDRLCALHFATNGYLTDKIIATRDHISRKHKKINQVYTVSIDGPESLHDEIRGVKGAWKNAIDTFKLLNATKAAKAHTVFTISRHNTGRFEDFFRTLKDVYPQLKFDDIGVNIFQQSSFYYDNQDMEKLDEREIIKEIGKILKMDKEKISLNNFLRRTYLKLYLKYIKTKRSALKCRALSSTCVLDPYGDIFPCSVYDKKLLNIKDLREDFSDIWNSDYIKAVSLRCSNGMCPSCWTPCDAYNAIAGSLVKACLSNCP
ncbi:radical SAM protein [Candidatus Omnitrophota bacterium]